MKISKIIDELTELQKYIGDKELEACIANAATTGVNVMYENDDGGITSTSLEGEKIANLIKETTSEQEVHDENMETHDMNANKLQTEAEKIQWLENEIRELEYVLSSDCINRNLKLNQLQMYREHLDVLKNNQTETKLELEEEKIITMCNIACEEFFKQPAITDILKMAPVENLAHDIAEELVTHAWSLLNADETNKMLNKGVEVK